MVELASSKTEIRDKARDVLHSSPTAPVLACVYDKLCHQAPDDAQELYLDLLRDLGALRHLSSICAEGWYEELANRMANFEDARVVMGGQFLALSVILGIRITSIITDPVLPENGVVEFMIGKDRIHSLTLNEYKIRVVKVLLQDQTVPKPAGLPLTMEDAVSLIGVKNVLLAGLFGISVDYVIYGGQRDEHVNVLVGCLLAGEQLLLSFEEFIEQIKDNLRDELAQIEGQALSLDLRSVDRAREAAAVGDAAKVMQELEKWPGLMSLLQRTGSLEKLSENQRSLLGEGAALLGEALEELGQGALCEDLYRLGLQFARDGVQAARIFFNLGVLMNSNERFGEAIGFLRRAMALGGEEEQILPALGHAFLHCDKVVPAAALLEHSAARGYWGARLESDLGEVRAILDKAGVSWNIPLAVAED